MSYVADIPKPEDVKSQSQPLIRGNFNALVPFSESYANFPRISTPTITTTNLGVYGKVYGTPAQTELFVKSATGAEIPFTAKGVGSAATNGWCYLPSGILLKWGSYSFVAATISSVDVGTISTGPAYTAIFQTIVTSVWGGPEDQAQTTSRGVLLTASGTTLAGNFTALATNYSATRSKLNYLVIGV